MDLFMLFKTILAKDNLKKDKKSSKFTDEDFKKMFLQALSELKYMGYLSQTKQSTFIFKKNYFGKAKHSKAVHKTEKELDQEQKEIRRQFKGEIWLFTTKIKKNTCV